MNASLWQLAGWTMIHSLWFGAAVALAGGFLRLAARRAATHTRYAISLATLAALAATPLAAAAWLSVNGVPQLAAVNMPDSILLPLPLGEGWGEGQNPLATMPSANAAIENPSPNPSLPGRGTAGTPGRMPGLSAQVIDLAHATTAELDALATQSQPAAPPATTPPLASPIPHSPLPIPPTDHRSLITNHLLPHLPTLWLIGAPLTFTLLATGLVGSARLRRRATPLLAGPAHEACERLRQTLNITRRVALAVSDGVAQPILVGIVRPLILLPAAALAGWTPEQLDMVLLHELAHVRRRDNLVNLLQRIVESILFFHPAVWLLSRQVRRDREECCDAAVIAHTDRPHQYAELLVSIASALRGGPAPSLAVASAMASHPLAGRIRRILNLEEEPMRITRRTLAVTLLLPLLLAAAIFYSGANAEDGNNPPPSQGGARGGIPNANQPSTLTNDEEAHSVLESPKAVEKSGKEAVEVDVDAPLIRRVYPIKPGTLIDPLKLAEAIESGVEMQTIKRTFGDSTELSIIISAPQKTHDRVHALLSQSLPGSDAELATIELSQLQSEIRNLESLVAKTQEDLTNIEVFKELAVQNSQNPAALEKAIAAELDKEPTIKLYQQQLNEMQSLLKERVAKSKDPNSTDIQRTRATIQQSEAQLVKYRQEAEKAIRGRLAKLPNETLRAATAEYNTRRQAAEENLAKYQQQLAAARERLSKLGAAADGPGPSYPSSAATGSNANNAQPTAKTAPASAPYADAVAPRTDFEIPLLQNEIRNLQSLILKAQEDLTNVKVFKELAIQKSQNDAAIDAAVRQELESDRELSAINDRILDLDRFIDSGQLTAAKNDELKEQRKKFEREKEARQSELMKSARERVAEKQKDDVRQATAEFNIRRQAIDDNIAKYQQDLEAAKTKLLQLGANPAAPAPEPAPLLDRLEQLRLAFDQQRPLFSKQPDEQLQKVRYDGAKLPDIVGDHWPYLVKGIANKPGEPPISWGWTGLGNKNYELEAPAAAHEKLFRPLFDGRLPSATDAQLDTWRAAVAALGEQDGSPPNDAKRSKLADAERRARKDYFDGRLPTVETESAAASTPKKKLSGWQQPENKGADATSNLANDAPPPVNAAPASAAPVQESETPAKRGSEMTQEELEQKLTDTRRRLENRLDELKKSSGKAIAPTQAEVEIAAELQQRVQEWQAAHDARAKERAAGRPVPPKEDAETSEIDAALLDTNPDAGLQEKVVRFPPGFPNTDQERNRIRQELEAQGFKVEPTQFKFMKATKSGKIEERVEICLRVSVPKDWHAKHVWEERIGPNGEPQKTLRLINDNAPPQPSAPAYQTPDRQTPPSEPKALNDNAMPVEEHGPATPPSPFPTLENQKIADRGYKLLGIELEPADGEDLERIKKLGYSGGLRITASHQRTANILEGDLLVGLHVWPITDLKSLDEVLQRDDLGELSPLKHYVIRKKGSGGFGPSSSGEDAVVTGRLSIPEAELLSRGLEQTSQTVAQLAASAPAAGDLNPYASKTAPSVTPPSADQTFLYDGKTFDQWRDLWKLELNPERRTEAINALAAFGRTGREQEAVDAILDVALEYDFQRAASDKSLSDLYAAIQAALVAMPQAASLPPLVERIERAEKGTKQAYYSLASGVLRDANSDSQALPHILAIAKRPELGLQEAAALALLRQDPLLENQDVLAVIRQALSGDEPSTLLLHRLRFRHLDKAPEQFDLLFHPDPEVQKRARQVLQMPPTYARSPRDAEEAATIAATITQRLLAVLDDPARQKDHVAAVRALVACGTLHQQVLPKEQAEPVIERLRQILREGEGAPLLGALLALQKWERVDAGVAIKNAGVSDERAKQLMELFQKGDDGSEQIVPGGGGMGGGAGQGGGFF